MRGNVNNTTDTRTMHVEHHRIGLILLAAYIALSLSHRSVQAQGFRIETTVGDLQRLDDDDQPTTIASSLTLFHHGKVYDYLSTVGEVLIFERARNQVTILSTSRSLATTVDFDEIRHLLKSAENELTRYIEQQRKQLGSSFDNVAQALEFQLTPTFDESFDKDRNQLVLSSPSVRYVLTCAESHDDDSFDALMNYADWMARLNFVLHNQAFFPHPRLAVNEALRRHHKLPIEVELHAHIEHPVHLRAQHRIGWRLDSVDRRLIDNWESQLRSRDLTRTTFRKYQQAILESGDRVTTASASRSAKQ